MKITDVRVRKVAKEGKMKAVVSITIDDEFVVHDIKVIEGEKVCSSLCPAERLPMENTAISHIRLTQRQENGSRKLFWNIMRQQPQRQNQKRQPQRHKAKQLHNPYTDLTVQGYCRNREKGERDIPFFSQMTRAGEEYKIKNNNKN